MDEDEGLILDFGCRVEHRKRFLKKDNIVGYDIIPELSVVVLCYRAGKTVRGFVERICQSLERGGLNAYQLVLVANYLPGSADETPGIVKDLARQNPSITYVSRPKEGMMGWDMKAGFSLARGKYIAVIDGDGQVPIEDLIRVYRELTAKNLDLVNPYRVVRGDGSTRKVVSRAYNTLFRLLFPGMRLRDVNAKPKIFTRAAFEKLDLCSNDWFIDAEIMIQARRFRFKTGEIPTSFLGLRGDRKSFINASTALEFFRNLLVFRIREFFVTNP